VLVLAPVPGAGAELLASIADEERAVHPLQLVPPVVSGVVGDRRERSGLVKSAGMAGSASASALLSVFLKNVGQR
jgi:hypothetical protein